MGKDCATILTGFEELQKGEIEKKIWNAAAAAGN